MAKATTTIRQVLRKAQAPPVGAEGNHQSEHGAWFGLCVNTLNSRKESKSMVITKKIKLEVSARDGSRRK